MYILDFVLIILFVKYIHIPTTLNCVIHSIAVNVYGKYEPPIVGHLHIILFIIYFSPVEVWCSHMQTHDSSGVCTNALNSSFIG